MCVCVSLQAQLGHFEYIYSDTMKKPRWWLILHQLTQKVERRRTIVEMHSEWGMGISFLADLKRRALARLS